MCLTDPSDEVRREAVRLLLAVAVPGGVGLEGGGGKVRDSVVHLMLDDTLIRWEGRLVRIEMGRVSSREYRDKVAQGAGSAVLPLYPRSDNDAGSVSQLDKVSQLGKDGEFVRRLVLQGSPTPPQPADVIWDSADVDIGGNSPASPAESEDLLRLILGTSCRFGVADLDRQVRDLAWQLVDSLLPGRGASGPVPRADLRCEVGRGGPALDAAESSAESVGSECGDYGEEVGKALVKCFEVEEFVDVRINAVRLVAKKALRGDPHVVDGLLMLVRRDRSSQVE